LFANSRDDLIIFCSYHVNMSKRHRHNLTVRRILQCIHTKIMRSCQGHEILNSWDIRAVKLLFSLSLSDIPFARLQRMSLKRLKCWFECRPNAYVSVFWLVHCKNP